MIRILAALLFALAVFTFEDSLPRSAFGLELGMPVNPSDLRMIGKSKDGTTWYEWGQKDSFKIDVLLNSENRVEAISASKESAHKYEFDDIANTLKSRYDDKKVEEGRRNQVYIITFRDSNTEIKLGYLQVYTESLLTYVINNNRYVLPGEAGTPTQTPLP